MKYNARKVLICGAQGRLGALLCQRWSAHFHQVQAIGRVQLDLSAPERVAQVLQSYDFDLLVNAAGMADVDLCERDPELTHRVNVESPTHMAQVCQQRSARMIQISTDYVFAGDVEGYLSEEAEAKPLNAYGRSKRKSELAVLAVDPTALVVRVSWLFGGHKGSFPDRILQQAMQQLQVSAVNDKWASPTYAEDLSQWLLAWLQRPWQGGLLHLCNTGSASWAEYGQEVLNIAQRLGVKLATQQVHGHTMQGFAPFIAQRPVYTALSTARFTQRTGVTPRHWQQALEEHLRQRLKA
jgi:dTDP-4-dehydrorhamnose reductase